MQYKAQWKNSNPIGPGSLTLAIKNWVGLCNSNVLNNSRTYDNGDKRKTIIFLLPFKILKSVQLETKVLIAYHYKKALKLYL